MFFSARLSRERKPELLKPEQPSLKQEAPKRGFWDKIWNRKTSAEKAGVVERKKRFEVSDPNAPLIVIDPGHGGEDLGAEASDGTPEKEVVLNISFYLDELLRERLGVRTLLTRARDVFIPLPERAQMANAKGADLFISIHANASRYKSASGIETYYLDNTNDKSSLKLAKRENASIKFGGQNDDLSFILSDLIQNAKLDDSISLAHHLQRQLYKTVKRYYPGVKNLGVKKAPFYVLVGAHMPCVLTEVSFIDHPKEGARLLTVRYQKLIAEAIYRGLRSYLERNKNRTGRK